MKCALILIPGLDPVQQDHYRDLLVRNLVTAETSVSVLEQGDAGVPGERAVCLQVGDGGQGAATVHVYEAWWGDLVGRPEQQTPARAILEGFQLLAYWLHPRLRPALAQSRFLSLSLVLSSLLLLLWYLGILTAGLAAIGADGSLGALSVHARSFAETIGGHAIWVALAGVLALLPVNALVAIAGFTRRYLTNMATADGTGLRDAIRARVHRVLKQTEAQGYDRIVILAHSFGTVIATDLIADMPPDGNGRLQLITLGSPARVLAYRSRWLCQSLERAVASPVATAWHDYYSEQDWMCSAMLEADQQEPERQRHRLEREAPLVDRLAGVTHKAYFRDRRVLRGILALFDTSSLRHPTDGH